MSHRRRTDRAVRRIVIPALLAVLSSAAIPLPTFAQSGDARKGAVLYEARDYAAARTEFAAFLRQHPRDASALSYMGRIASQQGSTSEAVDWLEKAIKANDAVSDYHLWLGGALGEETMKASKFRQPFLARRVKTEFEKAVALDPRSIGGHLGLMQFYAYAPGFMGGSAEKARQQAAAIAGISALQGRFAMASLALHDKDEAGARREYDAAIAIAPDSTSGYYMLGSSYQRGEQWTDATAVYERMLKRIPGDRGALLQIGRVAALSGQNLARGEQVLKLWLTDLKDSRPASIAGAHLRLGQIYQRQGKRDIARSEIEESLRINPDSDDAKKALASLK